jgi:hypothetical protein
MSAGLSSGLVEFEFVLVAGLLAGADVHPEHSTHASAMHIAAGHIQVLTEGTVSFARITAPLVCSACMNIISDVSRGFAGGEEVLLGVLGKRCQFTCV